MVATLRELDPEFGRATEALLRQVAAMGSTRDVVLSQFLADLGTLKGREVLVILDDYHLVSGSEDVRLIVGRLLERAPTDLHLIMSCRVRPSLGLGRLAAQGNVAELTTSDLRFSRPEIEELFAKAYAQPLDAHACDVVVERTQGWAASLQLVSASIAVSRPSEVGTFIEALDGATGPIYDFLAEEVLSRMPPLTHRVLVHASLIDRVAAPLVAAALSVTDAAPDLTTVAAHLEEARVLGLLGGPDSGAPGERIHPLFRQFLQHQLVQATSAELIRAMHLEIARVAEQTSWLASAKHYALAGADMESMRVLGSAAGEALGTGAWGTAVEVVALIPDTTPPPAVEVIKARALTSEGRPDEAIANLRRLDRLPLTADEKALVSLARASAFQMAGESDCLWNEVRVLAETGHSDRVVNRLSEAWSFMRQACQGGSIAPARRSLDLLAAEATSAGLSHFAGIAFHNAATAALAQGEYIDASELAASALEAIAKSPVDASIGPSSLITLALAKAELGYVDEGVELATRAAAHADVHPDVLADCAYLAAIRGDVQRAESLEHRLKRLVASGPVQVGAHHQAAVARATRLIVTGRAGDVLATTDELMAGSQDELDGVCRSAYLVALASTVVGSTSARADVDRALALAETQQAWRWEYRLRILRAVVTEDAERLQQWVGDCEQLSALAILELADAIGASLHLLDPLPQAVRRSISHNPMRWRAVLRRQLPHAGHPRAHSAARLLTEYGTHGDASYLRAYEEALPTKGRKTQLSRLLVRRVSPTLRIHDLGRTTYEVAGAEMGASAARRKALALILYLVTRPRQTATREQAMEELWPSQSPFAALNSLHQTLHFVRRDIAPWLGEGVTADYVPLDSETLYLDPELVQVDSVAFMRLAADAFNSKDVAGRGAVVSRLYAGRFAPEFEYEDWAGDWRTLVHAQFLRLSQVTAAELLASHRTQSAIDVLQRAVELDNLAFELRASLIRALSRAGAKDAAADHYKLYAQLSRENSASGHLHLRSSSARASSDVQ